MQPSARKDTSILAKRRDHPLPLGQIDEDVQKFVKALRLTGIPENTAVFIAAPSGTLANIHHSQLQNLSLARTVIYASLVIIIIKSILL